MPNPSPWKKPLLGMKLAAVLLIGIVVLNLWYQSKLRVRVTKITTKEELKGEPGQFINLNSSPKLVGPFEFYQKNAPDHKTGNPIKHLKKVNLISLWASWCTSCKDEFPQMQNLFTNWQDQGFQILSINTDAEDKIPLAVDMYKSFNLEFPLFLDPKKQFINELEVRVLPTHFLVSESGEILLRMEGATQWQSSHIQDLIKEHL